MIYRVLGACLIVLGCGGAGFLVAANARRETATLKSVITVLEYWKNELSFHLTPLPELCRQSATQNSGIIGQFLDTVATELERQISPNVEKCIYAALHNFTDMPVLSKQIIESLAKNLGRFDIDGMLQNIESSLSDAHLLLEQHTNNQDLRVRNYRTLGLCAGAAIVILFI